VVLEKIVMAGLVQAIYVFRADVMPGTSPGRTMNNVDLAKL
jgi:hypothetical protein